MRPFGESGAGFKSIFRHGLPFWLLLAFQRGRRGPTLLLNMVATVGVVRFWLLGLVFLPNGRAPPKFFGLVLGDVLRASQAEKAPFLMLRFVRWNSGRLLVVAVGVVVLDRRVWRAVKVNRRLSRSVEQRWKSMALGPRGTRCQWTLKPCWTRC